MTPRRWRSFTRPLHRPGEVPSKAVRQRKGELRASGFNLGAPTHGTFGAASTAPQDRHTSVSCVSSVWCVTRTFREGRILLEVISLRQKKTGRGFPRPVHPIWNSVLNSCALAGADLPAQTVKAEKSKTQQSHRRATVRNGHVLIAGCRARPAVEDTHLNAEQIGRS